MKRIFLILAALLLLTLVGCGKEPVPPNHEDITPKVYTVEELTGLSAAEIIAIYGEDYTEVVPEGDPPYFFYEGVPYRFIGTPEDEKILAVSCDVVGTEMLTGVAVGDVFATLEETAIAGGYAFHEPDNWYDDGFGVYGWAHVMGQGRQYSCYIMDEVLTSFECRLWDK